MFDPLSSDSKTLDSTKGSATVPDAMLREEGRENLKTSVGYLFKRQNSQTSTNRVGLKHSIPGMMSLQHYDRQNQDAVTLWIAIDFECSRWLLFLIVGCYGERGKWPFAYVAAHDGVSPTFTSEANMEGTFETTIKTPSLRLYTGDQCHISQAITGWLDFDFWNFSSSILERPCAVMKVPSASSPVQRNYHKGGQPLCSSGLGEIPSISYSQN
jgi:hypothetical protein